MLSVYLICVGKLKEKFYLEACSEYYKRLSGYCKLTLTELPEEKRQEIRTALLCELSELECAFDLLDLSENPDLGGVLRNILYLGMPKEAERVLFPGNGCTCDSPEATENMTER